jgi:signal transduction histidine kinase
MMLIKELNRLLKTIVLKVVDIVCVCWAAVYLKDEKEQKYLLKHKHARAGDIGLPQEFSSDSDLVKHLYKEKLPIIGEEIHSQGLKVGLAVPCFIEDKLLGFLLLGNKPKGQIYDESDVNVFTFLSNQTALAIENCQFYFQERQLQHYKRLASLDRQIASMAHEIDNPNAGILAALGSLEMSLDELKDTLPDERLAYLKKKIERARYNSKRITKMIEAVQEYSKPSTGELTLVSLQDLIESFYYVVEPQLKFDGIDYIQEVLQEEVWLRADKVGLEQVLVNMANNSVQAIKEQLVDNPQNQKRITLKAYRTGSDKNTLRIDFSDTGSGIKKELLEDIFLDFVTTKASSVGTGLGLSISRKIISRHKGRLWAESGGTGKGATFHIELPIPQDITEQEIRKAKEEKEKRDRRIIF